MDSRVKELLEKIKTTAGVAADAAGRAAHSVGKKAGEMVESTKLNLKILDLSSENEVAYKQIGKLVYQTHTGEEIGEDELDALLRAVDERNTQIADIRKQLSDAKTIVTCVNCGCECDKTDDFCRRCGAQL